MKVRDLFQLLYPAQCRSCGSLVSSECFLCHACIALVKPVVSLFVPISKHVVLKVYAAGAYDDPLRPLVLKKISSDLLASKQLALFMLDMIPFSLIQADVFVPVPLHWTRYARRGYNQAHEIAKVVGHRLKVPVLPLVSRTKRTAFQAYLSADKRQENVTAAFKKSWWYASKMERVITGKNVVLVDDLYTTGSTIKSVAQVLVPYKPKSLTAVVACRAI